MGVEVKIPYSVHGNVTECTVDIPIDEIELNNNKSDMAAFTTELFLQMKAAASNGEAENWRKRSVMDPMVQARKRQRQMVPQVAANVKRPAVDEHAAARQWLEGVEDHPVGGPHMNLSLCHNNEKLYFKIRPMDKLGKVLEHEEFDNRFGIPYDMCMLVCNGRRLFPESSPEDVSCQQHIVYESSDCADKSLARFGRA